MEINKIWWIIIAIVLIGGGFWYYGAGVRDSVNGPIKVGFIDPLSGDAASLGEALKNAVAIGVDEINANGGIDGRLIEMIYEDGKCSGPVSATVAQKLIFVDKVKYIIGGGCSGETLGAAPIAEANKVILMSPVSSSPDITKAGDYIFRNFASDTSSGTKIARVLYVKDYKKIAVISEQTDYSQALRKVFEDSYTKLDGEIVYSEGYAPETKDFRTQIAKIKASSPDAMYLIPQSPHSGEVLLTQLREVNVSIPMFSNELVTTPSFLKSGISEGIIYAEVSFDKDTPESKIFFDKYVAKYKTVDPNTPPIYIASAYDSINLLRDMLVKYGDNVDKVKGGLYKVKNWKGIAGPLTLDENGDAVKEYVLKIIKNGKIESYQI